jgi:hypothetical protein
MIVRGRAPFVPPIFGAYAHHLLTGQAISLELEERQQVGIDRVRFRRGHSVREDRTEQ